MLHVLPPTFKLACVAGVQKEGKRDFGRTNSLPLTFVTPATQASLNLSCNSKVARFFFRTW